MEGWSEFALAYCVFIALHAIPARPAVRERLVAGGGKRAYMAGYIFVSIALLYWLILAAGRAPYVELWAVRPWQIWAPNLAMLPVCLLVAFGVAAPNPLSFGGANNSAFDPRAPGIAGVARHPILWALALWALAHLPPNGDLAHVVLFGGLAAFALAGMIALDRRNRRRLGQEKWRGLAAQTSGIPLTALVSGRWRPCALPGAERLLIGLAAWLALHLAHLPLFGVAPSPL